jgi:hypothetical protein
MSQRSNLFSRGLSLASSSNRPLAPHAPRRHAAQSAPAAVAAPSDQERPMGVALIASPDLQGGRAYRCDPEGHCIDVLDQDYHPLFSFGGHGSNPGQFDSPCDAAIVWLDDGALARTTADSAVLAIADRGNNRIQLCELDGAPLCSIGGPAAAAAPTGWPARAGYPFFRLAGPPPMLSPSRLEWRSPYLDVLCSGTTMVRIDLAAALLPEFTTWVRDAPASELRKAFRRFALHPHKAEVPAACLVEMAERLQPTRRRAVTLPWRARA